MRKAKAAGVAPALDRHNRPTVLYSYSQHFSGVKVFPKL